VHEPRPSDISGALRTRPCLEHVRGTTAY
jgi:hypothetical protein